MLHFGRLLQQYIVDNYVKLETQRLGFYKTQQHELWQEFLQGVVDAIASGETDVSTIGKPQTFEPMMGMEKHNPINMEIQMPKEKKIASSPTLSLPLQNIKEENAAQQMTSDSESRRRKQPNNPPLDNAKTKEIEKEMLAKNAKWNQKEENSNLFCVLKDTLRHEI